MEIPPWPERGGTIFPVRNGVKMQQRCTSRYLYRETENGFYFRYDITNTNTNRNIYFSSGMLYHMTELSNSTD
jgi:hypothetical protein